MNEPNVNPIQQPSETVSPLHIHNEKPQKTAQDWVRDMRMSAAVNKSNTGVETDQVTPELMLATSKKLLGISKREQEPDAKDSLAFQRFYGPEMLFQERILRDGGKLARNILWKATNRGNLDFMPVNALEKHISSVFYDSKLAQMMDGSSPLETIDAAYKTTRIGEGGVSSMDSAPDEMRTVQPSYFGFIDPVRCFAKGTELMTEDGWKLIEDVTTEDKTLVKTNDGYKYIPIKQTYKFSYSDVMIGYDDGVVGFLVTPHHRLYVKDCDGWRVDFADNLYGSASIVNLSETEELLHTLDPDKWYRGKSDGYVYCVTVENELIMTRFGSPNGLVILNSPESFRVGLDVYMTKNVMKGTDGKLYQKFIDAKTGKEVLLDSETAANSVIAAPEMRNAKTKSIFALGGPTGVRIVPRDSVQYYLPRADEAYSTSSNLVTMLSGVKEMRLQMGCLHPDTQVLTIDKKNLINIDKAQVTSIGRIPGSTKEGQSKVFDIRTTVAKFPPKRNWFYKIVLRSGRSLITSADHRWSVLRKGQYQLIPANKLKPGDQALRTTFKDVISRRTFVNGIQVNKDIAKVFGYIARSLAQPDNEKLRITIPENEYANVMKQLARLGYTEGFNTYYVNYAFCIGIRDPKLKAFLIDAFGPDDRSRKLPSFILSANAAIVAAFLDGYTADPTKVGKDSIDDIWILELPNQRMRDSIAFLFARIETDTLYRDCVEDGVMHLALKLVPMEPAYGDMLLDDIKVVKKGIPGPIMVDIDVNDNLYATANGIVTHNSKYPLQAISVQSREAPLVRGLDEATGKDMHSLIGKYLGARFAPQDGIVTAVRKDRIDVQYKDGSKGSIDLYVNFPMNAKGFINNTPQVKAGQAFKKGDCLASSNYTDDKGVAALGTNLRSAWMSWKGGTYEDAIVISESAAKKLTSDTMYKTSVDLDKTVKLGKKNYLTWKPGEFTKEQMEALDDNGIVKPGTVLHKEDPMILAVRMTEPSPGTMGKRILTDMSERWEHDHPGVVTDVVKTRNGIKVYATVTAPVEIGDKLSGNYGNKGVVSQIIPDSEMPTDKKTGKPIEILLSPLGLISRVNPSQLYESLLGKVAAKTGKPISVPQFLDGSISEYVNDQLKQNGIKPDDDMIDPVTGKVMPNILNGVSYIYKLKHMSADKMSARGTSTYDSEEMPGGKGFDGCFPGDQIVAVRNGWRTIRSIARSLNTDYVTTCSDDRRLRYYRAIDRFKKVVPAEDIITITPSWSFDMTGYCRKKVYTMAPTKNHAIYMYDMTQKHAGDLKVGDKLAGMGLRPSDDQMQVLANLLSMPGIVENDTFTVAVDADHSKLLYFKYKMLRSLGAKLDKENNILSLPSYSVYNAAITEADFGELAVCLHQLDSDATCAIDGKVSQLIAKWVPARYIPDTKPALKEFVKKAQALNPSIVLNMQPDYGVMPIIVAKVEQYKTDKPCVTVYDLTIENTHKYVLKGGFLVSNSKRFGTLEQSAMAGHCLMGLVRVYTKEYGYLPMAQIVKERMPVTVLSYNKDLDTFEWKQVTNWFARAVKQEDLWRVVTNAKQERAEGSTAVRGYHHALRCTKEHKILTPDRGWIQACELKPGDLVYERGHRLLDWQKQIIMGTLMGDGYMSSHKNAIGVSVPMLKVAHGPKQHAYTNWMYDKLKNICRSAPSIHERRVGNAENGFNSGTQARMSTVNCYELTQICDEFYKDIDGSRTKTVPAGIIERLGYAGIAVWYMDDGNIERNKNKPATAMTFSTCGFTVEECERLVQELNNFTGLNFSLLMKAGKYPIIRLKHGPKCKTGEVSQTEIFSKALAPYIIEDFRYKLGDNYPKDAPVGTFWSDKTAPDYEELHGEPCVVISSEADHEPPSDGYIAYDITVPDNHNFIASGIVVSNSAFDVIKDAKYIRGQANSDFWRSIRTGDIPTVPGEPLVHKKFFAHLTGAGINVKKTPQGVSIFALTNKDVSELAGPRELKTRDTYEAKNFRPIDGGLFGQDIFGINGDKWGYIQLDSPVPNPVMEEPLARLLGIPEKRFADVASGKEEINGIKGGASMKAALEKINLDAESAKALNNFKTATPSGKDKMLKRYIAIERMRRAGVKPSDYMLDKIPVIPPIYRPISAYNGLTMVADSNYLYAQLMDARDDAREAKDLPKEYQEQAEENIYTKWKELTGLYAPQDIKLQSKHVNGLLKWALGDSPKFGAFQRKVLSSSVDTVGRGVITPDPRLKVNQVGLPEAMAFGIMAPIVERALVKQGYTPIQAMEKVKKRDAQARDALNEVMASHPVLINRAPTLHKLGIMALHPILVTGNAIRTNPSLVPVMAGDYDGDQVNIHVPVSYNGIREANERMLPDRNLISMRKREILFKPEKEYQQGLYIATRMKSGPDVRTRYFNTLEEARQAYRDGLIDVDDPIVIKEN